MFPEVLRISSRIIALPVIHGSGDCALEVRRLLLQHPFECVAAPLPESFRVPVEAAIAHLPTPTLVVQRESPIFGAYEFGRDDRHERPDEETREARRHSHDGDRAPAENSSDMPRCNFVPIDPCQPVIAALRMAIEERWTRAYVDLECTHFEPYAASLPDAYALKKTPLARFAAALLPWLPAPQSLQRRERIAYMAAQLRRLETRHESIAFVCSVLDWPWVREAYRAAAPAPAPAEELHSPEPFHADPKTLHFVLGELPYITGLYERARAELEDDANLSIDGVKELLLSAREAYLADLKKRARRITPHLLGQCLKYIRNLTLLEDRLTPDLYTIAVAAQQTAGDQFALHLVETAVRYPYASDAPWPTVQAGVDRLRLPHAEVCASVNRLAGPPCVWRSLELRRRPERQELEKWNMQWNPYSQCSWPPEDDAIESFRSHAFDRTRQLLGADLARTEKFTTSIQDGIDIRETLRHWYAGEIYVRVLPPARGNVDALVMLFDSPADPRDYPWRSTWYAEHEEESTLAFFATDFRGEAVGPGICAATYGGALFIFPPMSIPDIWTDRNLDFVDTVEERLISAACLHSRCGQISLMSPAPPGAGWRKIAKRFGKRLVHLPLSQFNDATIQQLRIFHVLNGKQVRSYAAHFVRKA